MTERMCLGGCGRSTSRAGGRCRDCAPAHERGRHNRAYDTGAYRSARNRAVDEHRRQFGERCFPVRPTPPDGLAATR